MILEYFYTAAFLLLNTFSSGATFRTGVTDSLTRLASCTYQLLLEKLGPFGWMNFNPVGPWRREG